ncbi:MAG TPA: c-type cytochrome, partial [Gammaproteobacteria bacterium]|nr:c-type cytochrome [Gammaproteobacteria bacterium]
IFENKGRCSQCHTGWNLTDEKYHNIGIDWDTSRIDVGRYAVTGETKDIGAFKTPTLREIALTAPYMHDGRFSTLRQVVNYYNIDIIANPYLDPELQRPILSLLETLEFYSEINEPDSSGSLTMKNINLTMQEERDLVAFLRTLSGEGWQNITPPDTFPN